MRLIFLSFILLSCSHFKNDPKKTQKKYDFKDATGVFSLEKDLVQEESKLISRTKLIANQKLVEKTFAISEYGGRGGGLSPVRPFVSQYLSWFEGKRYFSQIKLDLQRKKLNVLVKSPEQRWNGKSEFSFPRGKIFCFKSQLIECLKKSGALGLVDQGRKVKLYIVWDSFPFHQELYSGFSHSPFSAAVVYGENNKNKKRYIVEVNNQPLIFELENGIIIKEMYWIAQGIQMIKY